MRKLSKMEYAAILRQIRDGRSCEEIAELLLSGDWDWITPEPAPPGSLSLVKESLAGSLSLTQDAGALSFTALERAEPCDDSRSSPVPRWKPSRLLGFWRTVRAFFGRMKAGSGIMARRMSS